MLGRINFHPTVAQIRVFALTLALAALLLAAVLLLTDRRATAVYAALAGCGLAAVSALFTSVGKIVYLVWMSVGYALGQITSPIIAGVIFYLVVTPIGLFFRLTGRDNLRLKRPRCADSHYRQHSDISDRDHFRRQF